MKLKINGEIKSINNSDKDFFLEDLIKYLGYQPQLVVVELNGAIINSHKWINTKIKDGDCLEVVTIVGGGSYSELN
ncbi:sulfur carrier protein ThiS [Prochlorococcus marinus]|uniref:Thiamine biosynthesis protein ThiS n=1 Tax=Prochlorococcus marinus XMU1408 TaxID=2213228 RepID=A0A318R2N8_PROMR|nr:sulfur carrier protein ThiS [Prochlorococcus marinus]MBW3042456.1 thiamine biosynthesis protein ThiS [Prochlorococcus marinus str. XMU1408]PYE01191.1 thiamine biosynthesis protein ThiS [Prochlorococcus marinus XMU1408]